VNSIRNGIDLSYSEEKSDFYRGFYLTGDYKQAMRWADRKSRIRPSVLPVVLIYECSEKALMGLAHLRFSAATNEWKEFVYNNRTLSCDNNNHNIDCKYDWVQGPLCDGNMTDLKLVACGEMTKQEFINKNCKSIGQQISFHTEAAIRLLKLKGVVQND